MCSFIVELPAKEHPDSGTTPQGAPTHKVKACLRRTLRCILTAGAAAACTTGSCKTSDRKGRKRESWRHWQTPPKEESRSLHPAPTPTWTPRHQLDLLPQMYTLSLREGPAGLPGARGNRVGREAEGVGGELSPGALPKKEKKKKSLH